MSTALPLQLTLKYHDEAVAAGKKLYNKIFDVTPQKTFIGKKAIPDSVKQATEGMNKTLYQKYGNAFYTEPYRDPNLYKTQDDVLKAIALGNITKGYGKDLLNKKFNIKGLQIDYATKDKSKMSKIDNMLNDYVNRTPDVQQQYEDLIFHAGLLNPKVFSSGTSFRVTNAAESAAKNIAVLNASHINKAIDKAMDANYLSEYGPVPFYAKYFNALKDVIDPNMPIMNAYGQKALQGYIEGGKKIARARGLDLDFAAPVFQGRRIENQMGILNDGKTILPMSLFNVATKAAQQKKIINKKY